MFQKATKPADTVCPPLFGNGAAADNRRMDFDYKNRVLVTNETPVDIVFIGDSITHLWELNAYYRRFGLVINRGIGGDIAQHVAVRFEGDVLQLKPRLAVIMIGINNTWCLDEGVSPDTVFDTVTEAYRLILSMAAERNQPMLVCSILPVEDKSQISIVRNRLVVRINDALQALCRELGAGYVDYHAAVVDEEGLTLRSVLTDDGVHPHVIGYNIMADVLTPHLEQRLCHPE